MDSRKTLSTGKAEFLFLGTGASTGVPMIGCHCAVCLSKEAYNKRLRPSGLLRIGAKQLLFDAGPDLRLQLLTHQIDHLDGVLLTHTHFDHVAGLDELRSLYLIYKEIMPVLVSEATHHDLRKRYDYLFRAKSFGVSLIAQLDFHVMEGSRGTLDFLGVPLRYMTYEQGGMLVSGYRIGSFAYISDISHYPETIFEDLSGVRILVVSAARHEPSMMHFTLDEAISFAQRVGAQETYITHMGHELEYHTTKAYLPKGVSMAYDGLLLTWREGDE